MYELKNCNFFIVTVPTPIKQNKLPDLKYIVSAFKTISKYIKKGNNPVPNRDKTLSEKELLIPKTKYVKNFFSERIYIVIIIFKALN